ncbi:MAG TPA: hypothetical protein DD379_22720 [Cyanobacteria bacterium UBA11162]|nr:hypothetical protein [Cyanobacteria bacterium UBA11162]
MNKEKSNRKRGVLLTSRGWEKLLKAIDQAQAQENHGVRYTFEELSDRTGLTPRTVSRVLDGKQRVDKPTLEQVFRAFRYRQGYSVFK